MYIGINLQINVSAPGKCLRALLPIEIVDKKNFAWCVKALPNDLLVAGCVSGAL